MKRLLLILALLMPFAAHAADKDVPWSTCVKYDYSLQVSTNLPKFDQIARMRNTKGVQEIWFLYAPHRTKAQLANTNFIASAEVWENDENTVTPEMRVKAQEWVSQPEQVAVIRTIANYTDEDPADVRKYMKREYIKQLKP